MTETKAILYVEDNADSCILLRFLLENEGYKVETCETSAEGIGLAQRGGFSAIILDYYLPEINGVGVCQAIRTFDQETPIIFYSGASYRRDIKAGLEAGAQAYLVKPNDFDKLVETIAELTT